VILVDTGPLVALFERRDHAHESSKRTLATIATHIVTTVPVLTEAFHLLSPASRGAKALQQFVSQKGLGVWFLDPASLARCCELMDEYADHPMDLADASLVAAAESNRCTKVFTIDRSDFATYRARIGRTRRAFTVVS